MHLRTVALIGALSLAAGWSLGGRFASQDPGARGIASPSGGARPLGVEQTRTPVPLTEQLRLRLDRLPENPQPARNPFVFGRRPAPPPMGRGPDAPAPRDLPADGPIASPAPPTLSLSGIASAQGVDGVEHTAILKVGQQLLYVKAGDRLPGGDAVVAVGDTSVTIRDASGAERSLHLR